MKKNIVLIMFGLLSTVLLAQNYPFFPRTNVIESCYSTAINTPGYSNAFDVINEEHSDDEAIILQYFSTSGEYGNTETQAMIDNLNAITLPSLFFNGNKIITGFKPEFDNGNALKALMRKHYTDPTPVFVNNLTLNSQNGTLNCIILDAIDQTPIQNLMIQYMIIENNVNGNNNVVRAIQTENFSIATDGGQLSKTKTFTINPSWVVANLKAVVVIREQNYQVVQAITSLNYPVFKLRFVAPGKKYYKGVVNEAAEFPFIAIMNMDYDMDYVLNYRISFDPIYAPDSWSTGYCDSTQCYFGLSNQSMGAGSIDWYKPEGFPYETGSGLFKFTVTPGELDPISCYYQLITSDINTLVIDDDGVEDRESFYYQDLPHTGISFGVIDPTIWDINDLALSDYNTIIWSAQSSFSLFPNEKLTALKSVIEDGAGLLICGQNVGWTFLSDESTYKNTSSVDFYNSVLGADSFNDVSYTEVVGTNDMIGNGLNFNLIQGENAFAQDNPDRLVYTPSTTKRAIFSTGTNNDAVGISSNIVLGSCVYLGFGLEGVDNLLYRQAILNRSLTYLGNIVSNQHTTELKPVLLTMNIYPNPIKQSVQIFVNSKNNDLAEVTIFNIKGQKVKSIKLNKQFGEQKVIWNGKADNGQKVSNGLYFFRVKTAQTCVTQKALLLK